MSTVIDRLETLVANAIAAEGPEGAGARLSLRIEAGNALPDLLKLARAAKEWSDVTDMPVVADESGSTDWCVQAYHEAWAMVREALEPLFREVPS